MLGQVVESAFRKIAAILDKTTFVIILFENQKDTIGLKYCIPHEH